MSAPAEPLLILASQSPGRAQVLRQAGISFTQIVSEVDEDALAEAAGPLPAAEHALMLARAKAEAVAALPEAQGRIVLGCDSVFEFQGEIHGKPYTPERAAERLRAQSGKTGILHSGLWVCDRRTETAVASGRVTSTDVTFASLTEEEIQSYVATGEPRFCAGSFTIDGRGAAFVERIDGDPSAVIGISVRELRDRLAAHGVSISEVWDPS